MNGQPMEQDVLMAGGAGLPASLQPSPYVTPEHFTSLKYFQVSLSVKVFNTCMRK